MLPCLMISDTSKITYVHESGLDYGISNVMENITNVKITLRDYSRTTNTNKKLQCKKVQLIV
jgi:hypothetical protein